MFEALLQEQTTSNVGTNTFSELCLRLIAACVFGVIVAVAYRLHRHGTPIPSTFPLTLVLLSILIAVVMQVIDDRVARAFSLVGALSIVRFRTVLDDTQDIAFVIFSVVVGMAAGTGAFSVAIVGSVVVLSTLAVSFGLSRKSQEPNPTQGTGITVRLRTPLEGGIYSLAEESLRAQCVDHRLISGETGRGGTVMEWTFLVFLKPDVAPHQLLYALTHVEGIQNVEMKLNDPRK